MATTFAPINGTVRHDPLRPLELTRTVDDHTPTTPRPTLSQAPPLTNASPEPRDVSDSATPTRVNFLHANGHLVGIDQPEPQPVTPRSREGPLKRDGSERSKDDMEDVEMGDMDNDEANLDDDGSDGDSLDGDSRRPHKKKKGQRFFCTEYPPCQLSFTRSEHLARHIRKHTGERPFQCHCSRRFSRLDNLRQHAQTVHVNEEIPGDSLAATSTRFQRQIRTDRVRPPSSRSRASTIGSQGGHSRGHSRNLSTSSIGSVASTVTLPDDIRRRPQPLAMANDSHHPRLSLSTFDNPNSSPGQSYALYNHSPSGYSTPTSTVYSTGPGSPQLTSPNANSSRSSHYNGARHARRLSVPAAPHPFQGHPIGHYPTPYYAPLPNNPSSTFSPNSSVYGSPTSSVFSHSRHESETELELRRRTWHPSTYSNYAQRPATSGLLYQQTPDDQRPESSRSLAASQVTRLPGIESFDHVSLPTPRHPQSSPMMQDARPASAQRPGTDHGLHQGLTRLDLASANAPLDAQWRGLPPSAAVQSLSYPQGPHHHHSASMPERPTTPNRNKRHAWYGGPGQPPNVYAVQAYSPQRPSPEDSGSSDGVPTPLNGHGNEYHPVILNPNSSQAEQYHGQPLGQQSIGEDQVGKPSYYASAVPTNAVAHAIAPPPPRPTHHHTQQRSSFASRISNDPRYPPPPPFTFPQPAPPPSSTSSHQHPDPPTSQNMIRSSEHSSHDMGRLEALVAVATSEGRAAAAIEKGTA